MGLRTGFREYVKLRESLWHGGGEEGIARTLKAFRFHHTVQCLNQGRWGGRSVAEVGNSENCWRLDVTTWEVFIFYFYLLMYVTPQLQCQYCRLMSIDERFWYLPLKYPENGKREIFRSLRISIWLHSVRYPAVVFLVVTICTASLTIYNSTFWPHSLFKCLVWMWEQTAIISLYSIDWLVFISEMENVYCAVRSTFYVLPTQCI